MDEQLKSKIKELIEENKTIKQTVEELRKYRKDMSELKEAITKISITLEDVIKPRLDDIMKKQDYTNGKVRMLDKYKSYLLGGLTILSIMVIPLVLYIWNNK